MLLLIVDGWINGITASFSFLLGSILGLTIINQARKIDARLLLIMGFNIFISAFFWLANFSDFISVIFTSTNLPNPNGWLGIFYLMWGPLGFLISLYIGAELFFPEKKMYFIVPFLILAIFYELVIFINPLNSFIFEYPAISGENLIQTNFIRFGIPFILNYFFIISGLIFLGFGYLIKGISSKGIIRKKFFLLSVGYFLFIGFPILAIFVQSFYTYFVRLGMVSGFFFFYFGLREAPVEKRRQKPIKKELQVKESLFRLYERPDHITEEEVTFHRERKICLICKNDLSRLNYICPKCNALYCNKCSEELSNLENMCWVCDEPFDETKPIRPYKKVKPDKDMDVPRKT